MEQMKNEVIQVIGYGGAEVLRTVRTELPVPREDEVRVRVLAAGVALADVMRRKGVYPGTPAPPFTPGYDIVGIIEEAGKQVRPARIGTRVAVFLGGLGGYARYVCVPETDIVELPDNVSEQAAAAVILNYVTAWQLLRRAADVQPGASVLVHGASGGVGTALLELGGHLGLKLYGTASGRKHGQLARYSAELIDYAAADFVARMAELAPEGVDAVFDPIGPANWQRSLAVVKPGGQLIGYGFTTVTNDAAAAEGVAEAWRGLDDPAFGGGRCRTATYSVTGCYKDDPAAFRDDLQLLLGWLAAGRIRPQVAEVYPLERVADAHRELEDGGAVGKIVLKV
ncbi:zinc-binding dehydrogenase [Paenibacillus athensensis]|uniref:Enoyl reductase (ER) domain-containing protein n=1 Tax=Paenibacillus athensensis TaxID=1967502 RepID=A0A4Y8PW26_9BACL|nr:zinc-binding dehydrogenase [Paenibacillus athensensis]MCD1258196.1 zinc-binding dehydrogenase [Paenibacillus athensensis]